MLPASCCSVPGETQGSLPAAHHCLFSTNECLWLIRCPELCTGGLARDERQQSAEPRGPPNVIERPMGHSCEVCQKLKGNTGHRDFPEATYPCLNVASLCGNQKKTEYVLVLIDRKNFHGLHQGSLHQGCSVPRTAPGDTWGIREAP